MSGWVWIIIGILILVLTLKRKGNKLKKKRQISDKEFELWKQQFHTWNNADNVHLNVQRRVRERKKRK